MRFFATLLLNLLSWPLAATATLPFDCNRLRQQLRVQAEAERTLRLMQDIDNRITGPFRTEARRRSYGNENSCAHGGGIFRVQSSDGATTQNIRFSPLDGRGARVFQQKPRIKQVLVAERVDRSEGLFSGFLIQTDEGWHWLRRSNYRRPMELCLLATADPDRRSLEGFLVSESIHAMTFFSPLREPDLAADTLQFDPRMETGSGPNGMRLDYDGPQTI
jgi:hypothetical protein